MFTVHISCRWLPLQWMFSSYSSRDAHVFLSAPMQWCTKAYSPFPYCFWNILLDKWTLTKGKHDNKHIAFLFLLEDLWLIWSTPDGWQSWMQTRQLAGLLIFGAVTKNSINRNWGENTTLNGFYAIGEGLLQV